MGSCSSQSMLSTRNHHRIYGSSFNTLTVPGRSLITPNMSRDVSQLSLCRPASALSIHRPRQSIAIDGNTSIRPRSPTEVSRDSGRPRSPTDVSQCSRRCSRMFARSSQLQILPEPCFLSRQRSCSIIHCISTFCYLSKGCARSHFLNVSKTSYIGGRRQTSFCIILEQTVQYIGEITCR